MSVPLLISLPHGLNASGVTMWAVRIANARAALGLPIGVIVHPEPPSQRPLGVRLHPGVVRSDIPAGSPALGETEGDLSAFIPVYAEAVHRFSQRGPVVLSPNLHGDSHSIAAAIASSQGDRVRIASWMHSDNGYDVRVSAHYEPAVSRFIAVSARLAGEAGRLIAGRAGDIEHIPYGVPVPRDPPRRKGEGEALRLLYAGRLEHRQKRIMALIGMSDALAASGIAHRLTIMGDGPAAGDVDAAAAVRRERVRRLPAGPPDEVDELLDRCDLAVLASRFEGLSVSMLEAMARGVACIVTRVASGVDEAIRDGENGIVEPCGDGEEDAARALARGIARAQQAGVGALGRAAWEVARERFSMEQHADRVDAMLRACAEAPARYWPANRPCAFSGDAGGAGGAAGGSVPADAAARMRRVLESLAGEPVVIHGAGAHTRAIAGALADAPARILAITDDDRARHGATLWGWRIIAPEDAGRLGARHAVISSWLHEAAILARRESYERQGVRVRGLYAADA